VRTYRILAGKTEETNWNTRHRKEDNIKVGIIKL
jgi:hypothetical protein